MLRLRRVAINNFVCFSDVVVEPSTDEDRPLTVIRAENGSGKTTFLRALRWGMYGERGLPGDGSRFSLHPAWWQPDASGVKTKVELEFETDGSSRHMVGEAPAATVYQLVRSVTTVARPVTKDDEPDFQRINEQTYLMVKEGDGVWVPHTSGVAAVVEELLPWGLRDFFVMDADEATDFVGGSENKVVGRQEVIEKTTAAVHSLLGIDVFRNASRRLVKAAQSFGADATKAVGDADLTALQAQLEQFRGDLTELDDKLVGERRARTDLGDRLSRRRDDLEAELRSVGAADELRERLKTNRDNYGRTRKTRAATLAHLAGELEAPDLLASLATRRIAQAYETLRPLYEQGHIPLKHLDFVRELLRSGTCVCGQDLTAEGTYRRHVEERLAESAQQEERANFLGQLHDSAKSILARASALNWEKRRTRLAADLADADARLSDLALEKRDIDSKLDALDEEKIQVIRDEIGALEAQVDTVGRNLRLHEEERPPLVRNIDSLEKRIGQRQRGERTARDKRAAQAMANLVSRP